MSYQSDETGLEEDWEVLETDKGTKNVLQKQKERERILEEESRILEEKLRKEMQGLLRTAEKEEDKETETPISTNLISEDNPIEEDESSSEYDVPLEDETNELIEEPIIQANEPHETQEISAIAPKPIVSEEEVEENREKETAFEELRKQEEREEIERKQEVKQMNEMKLVMEGQGQKLMLQHQELPKEDWINYNFNEMEIIQLDPNFELYVIFGTLSLMVVHSIGLLTPLTRLCY